MKYIDSEKLIAEIERRRLSNRYIDTEGYENELLEIITSLQQEQPELDIDTLRDWSMRYAPDIRPGIEATAYHFWNMALNTRKEELPEIGLDKFTEKIKTFQGRYKYPEIVSIKGAMAFMARMFYQYPNVARQWYDSLPKATMD